MWQKIGRIFYASGQRPWMNSHATAPIPVSLGGDLYRVYFSSRDKDNRSHVSFVDIDITDPGMLLDMCSEPVLAPGGYGCFDDHGVYAGAILRDGDRYVMYYIGWNPGAEKPLFYSAMGIAESRDGGRIFQKVSNAPIMSRSIYEPCMILLPAVVKEGAKWRMWYGSGFKWEKSADGLKSFYDIKYAESDDGMQWVRNGHHCIKLRDGECNAAHPCVVKTQDNYEMWYSYSNGVDGYRIGFAKSSDGLHWKRMDDAAGIAPSETGWDSQMISHPHVIQRGNLKYMFYNGNAFGKDGFGLAIAEK